MCLLEELNTCVHPQLSTLLTLFQVGAYIYIFLQLQVPNRLGHGGRKTGRSGPVTAQQDTSKLPLAAVSDSEEERSG